MKRRDSLKLSVAAMAAGLAACGRAGKEVTGVKTGKEKVQAHSLAMFVLALQQSYRKDILKYEDQTKLDDNSRLKKVKYDVYPKMRKFFVDKVTEMGGEEAFNKYMQGISYFMLSASNAGHVGAQGDEQPYPVGDECPCAYNDSCPPVDELLNF